MNISVNDFVERVGDKKLTLSGNPDYGMCINLCDAKIDVDDFSISFYRDAYSSIELVNEYLDIEAHDDGSYTITCKGIEIYVNEAVEADKV